MSALGLDAAEAEAALARAEEEAAFWEEHAPELVQQYPDQFVAVHEGQIVAASPDLQELLQRLGTRKLDLRGTWVRFIAADPQRYLL